MEDKNYKNRLPGEEPKLGIPEGTDGMTPGLSEEEFAAEMEARAEIEAEESAELVKGISPMRLVFKRFFRSKLSLIGLSVIVLLFLFSFVGPLFTSVGELDFDTEGGTSVVTNKYTVTVADEITGKTESYTMFEVTYTEKGVNVLDYPSAQHWCGTDDQGRDVFVRLMYGGRISLTIGFVVVILETILGVILGGLAGFFGKWVDQLIMRIVDIFYCIPQMPILLISSALLNAYEVTGKARIYFLLIILTIFGWAGIARLVRGQILFLREQEYMVATQAMGLSSWRKILKHLIPNVMPQLIVTMTLGLGGIILTESTLSFLGLGVPIPYAAWGTMIGRIEDFNILQNHFHLWGPPGICIILAVLSFNFIGDGLRDAFDPKMKR